MSSKPRCGVLALLSLAASVGIASADTSIPSPRHSTIPTLVLACPGGDLPVQVVVRDFSGLPVGNSSVVLDLCSCTGATLCAADEGYVYLPPCRAQKSTTASATDRGNAEFRLHAAGTSAGNVEVFADGVLLGTPRFASVDQDGDLVVTASDVAAIESKIGSSDPGADLDGDGTVTSSDVAIATAHLGHSGDLNTAVGPEAPHSVFRAWPVPAHGKVQFALPPSLEPTRIEIFDLAGERRWSSVAAPGMRTATWVASARAGASGIYFARLVRNGVEVARTRVVLTR
jgi:hypothetical protein